MTDRIVEHGTYSTYSGHKCRCDACRAAASVYRRDLRQRRHRLGIVLKGPNAGQPPPHGMYRYTQYGCRCDICRAAHLAHHTLTRDRRRARIGRDR